MDFRAFHLYKHARCIRLRARKIGLGVIGMCVGASAVCIGIGKSGAVGAECTQHMLDGSLFMVKCGGMTWNAEFEMPMYKGMIWQGWSHGWMDG